MQQLFAESNISIARTLRNFAIFCVASILAGCGGDDTERGNGIKLAAKAVVVSTDVNIVAITKVDERRVSRTVFDYDFKVTAKNNQPKDLSGVVLTLQSVGFGATIIDGNATIGDIASGATAVSRDIITIRQDRTQEFEVSALVWQVSISPPDPEVPGILLPGIAETKAIDAVPEYEATRTATDLATAQATPDSPLYYNSQLQAVISSIATVADVNRALATVGARIVWSMERNRVVTLQIPKQANLSALQAVAKQLEETNAFESVSVYFIPEPSALPANVTVNEAVTGVGPILNQMAARMYAAWNTASGDTSEANIGVIVADYFGRGPATELVGPATGFLSLGTECQLASDPCSHGYHVLGILGGNFGGLPTPHGQVTGSLPRNLPLSIIDLSASPYNIMFWDNLRKLIAIEIRKNPERKFVVNFSLAYCNKRGGCSNLDMATKDAKAWRYWARGIYISSTKSFFDWDSKVFQVSAAGNNYGFDASIASPMNGAALLPAFIDEGDHSSVPPLANSLVVEARGAEADTVPYSSCRVPKAEYSNIGGNIAGVGTDVFSYTGPTSTGRKNGTSMATPQVAGIVAWMMAVRPDWPLSDIKYRIAHVRAATDTCTDDAPMVDAYAALLSLDKSLDDAPVRMALLRATATGSVSAAEKFTFSDAKEFLKTYFPGHYGMPAPIGKPDFSRFDLNGDGYSGDISRKKPFDLQFNGSNMEFVPETLSNYPNLSPIELLESAVTDFEILCYYVNSSLFDPAGRAEFDRELDEISKDIIPSRVISCGSRKVILKINNTFAGWEGLPATITMSNFVPRFPANSQGNSTTCTNQGEPAGERGTPFFSRLVPSIFPIHAAIDVIGVPTHIGRSSNRRNCSSFFATSGNQVWINATARTVFGFGGAVVSDWEYQVRYSNGDPNNFNAGKQCTVGVVPGSGVFSASFEASSCSHTVTATIKE
ncbi:S8 family serine peptidase [Massilia dura]|uniref:S8 family serine peptidase n=1 Tax=Pseudoduganella dura TaxID=321982 RepID=A0A6I3XIU2_9BURK|nr:S8 family serine peptidase [Pseudoduganella dura]MUI13581.1 S8 family serine peptidase [Pseudoduganella dura]GGX73862.1 hypothetical protein GCM10007386_00900 [Pseudoduganella dura]